VDEALAHHHERLTALEGKNPPLVEMDPTEQAKRDAVTMMSQLAKACMRNHIQPSWEDALAMAIAAVTDEGPMWLKEAMIEELKTPEWLELEPHEIAEVAVLGAFRRQQEELRLLRELRRITRADNSATCKALGALLSAGFPPPKEAL
jgi:hypothetical protein